MCLEPKTMYGSVLTFLKSPALDFDTCSINERIQLNSLCKNDKKKNKIKKNLGNITDQLQFETEIFYMSKPLSDHFQVDMSMIEAC